MMAELVHVVPAPVEGDPTVAATAAYLHMLDGADAARRISELGIDIRAVRLALSLTTNVRATNHLPNARHGDPRRWRNFTKQIANRDLFYRAAYVVNSARRMERSMAAGASPRAALLAERRNYVLHENARKARLLAAAAVARAAAEHGPLLSWNLDPELNNEAECIRASGCNFYIDQEPIIGYPGLVHTGCGCWAGPPNLDAPFVDDRTRGVISITHRRRAKVARP